jgi:hypothetical protein
VKVLDPACGSGAFLVKVFDYLLAENKRVANALAELRGGKAEIFDSESYFKDILKNNIFGVDLNPESVEITKLSLWLKTAQKGKHLASLEKNIKCGNSLIDDAEVAGERAFNWNEDFKEIMLAGGFDVVVGYPPYVRQELLSPYKDYFSKRFQCYTSSTDLFAYFYEQSLLLLKENGILGFISNTFTKTSGAGLELRKYLKNNSQFISLTDLSDLSVFEGATTYPIILILRNSKPTKSFLYFKADTQDLENLDAVCKTKSIKINQQNLKDEYWSFESERERNLKEKISQFKTVKDVFGKCFYGVKTGLNEAFIISEQERNEIIKQNPKAKNILKPFLEGKDLKKWHSPDSKKWIILFSNGWTKDYLQKECAEPEAWKLIEKDFPLITEHLGKYKEKAKKRYDQGGFWWELRACGYYNYFENPKILWSNLQASNKFSFDEDGYYINAPAVILPSNNKMLFCVLNSKLAWFFFKDVCVVRSGGYLELKPQYFEKLPIPKTSKEDQKPFIEKSDLMLALNKELYEKQSKFIKLIQSRYSLEKISRKLGKFYELDFAEFKKELKQTFSLTEESELLDFFEKNKAELIELKTKIENTDKEIDKLVFDLYGLDQVEREIILTS